eukprot:7383415-Prymnesium_polylepis.1
MQLSLFALPIAAACMCVYDFDALRTGNLLVGFNWWAWLAVLLNAVGGVAVSMALKYADKCRARPPRRVLARCTRAVALFCFCTFCCARAVRVRVLCACAVCACCARAVRVRVLCACAVCACACCA